MPVEGGPVEIYIVQLIDTKTKDSYRLQRTWMGVGVHPTLDRVTLKPNEQAALNVFLKQNNSMSYYIWVQPELLDSDEGVDEAFCYTDSTTEFELQLYDTRGKTHSCKFVVRQQKQNIHVVFDLTFLEKLNHIRHGFKRIKNAFTYNRWYNPHK